jgi:translation elongation factor EF-G
MSFQYYDSQSIILVNRVNNLILELKSTNYSLYSKVIDLVQDVDRNLKSQLIDDLDPVSFEIERAKMIFRDIDVRYDHPFYPLYSRMQSIH